MRTLVELGRHIFDIASVALIVVAAYGFFEKKPPTLKRIILILVLSFTCILGTILECLK